MLALLLLELLPSLRVSGNNIEMSRNHYLDTSFLTQTSALLDTTGIP